jgi:hypothetical protein
VRLFSYFGDSAYVASGIAAMLILVGGWFLFNDSEEQAANGESHVAPVSVESEGKIDKSVQEQQ